LRESAVAAAAFPITDEEIEQEIQAVRAERRDALKKKSA
jgi:hypothetical protein